jgi:hypothetical protein
MRREGPAFAFIEVDVAAALVLPRHDLIFATWDGRQHAAAQAEDLQLLSASRYPGLPTDVLRLGHPRTSSSGDY